MKILCMLIGALIFSSFSIIAAEETTTTVAPVTTEKVDSSNPATKVTFETVGNEKIELYKIGDDYHDPMLISIAPSLLPLTNKVTFIKMGSGYGSKEFEIDLEDKPQTYLLKKGSLGELIVGIVLTAVGGFVCLEATDIGLGLNSFGPTQIGNNTLLYGNLAGGISLLTGIILMGDSPGSVRRVDE